jgi:hypothetical protein
VIILNDNTVKKLDVEKRADSEHAVFIEELKFREFRLKELASNLLSLEKSDREVTEGTAK